MLLFLMQWLQGASRGQVLLSYITFRSAGAFISALLISFFVGPFIIRRLQRMAVHQVVREGTPDTHANKGSTPTMGGLIILAALVVPVLLWARLNNPYVLLALFVTLWMGAIGFWDDYLKLQQKRAGVKNEGLVERHKLAGQLTCGVILGVVLWRFPLSEWPGASTTLPFLKYVLIVPMASSIPWLATLLQSLYVPWVTFVLAGVSNAVNLTDGLDGLAAGLVAIAVMTLGIFAYLLGRIDTSTYLLLFYLPGSGELTVFCAALVGSCIGFLWHNAHPAQVFMGDTGSLALGGAVGSVAILLKSEFLLVFVGAVFLAEILSVFVQRYVFKYRKLRYGQEYAKANRVFLRAPIHHHFEEKGWKETQVVVRFWILGVLCAILALSTLKLR